MLEQRKLRWKWSPTGRRDCPWGNQWGDVEESIRMQISTPKLNSPNRFVVISEWQTFPAWLITACRLKSDYHLGLSTETVDLWCSVVKWWFDFFWSAGIGSNRCCGRIGKPLWGWGLPLKQPIALANEKEQTSATYWFCVRKNQSLENCRGASPLLQAA